LRGNDGDTFRLPRKTQEFFVARGFALPNSGEVLVFIAHEEDLAEIPVPLSLNFWNAI
jgi:hypothetical protein